MNPRLNRIPRPWPGGPNDDRDAEPVVLKCALCGLEMDDGQRDPPPRMMRCPRCGPVCRGCVTVIPPRPGTHYTPGMVCDYCGAEVKEASEKP